MAVGEGLGMFNGEWKRRGEQADHRFVDIGNQNLLLLRKSDVSGDGTLCRAEAAQALKIISRLSSPAP